MKKYIILLFLLIIPFKVGASKLYSTSIIINPGWNIISTPKVLESHSFSLEDTSNNFDIYVLDASKVSKWSTMADIGQTEFTPLYGYFINNKTGSNQTLTLNYKDVSISEQFFSRTFTSPGWYSFGVANPSYVKNINDSNIDIDNPDNVLQSLIGDSVYYGDVVDFTDSNIDINSVSVSDAIKSVIRSADISNNIEINKLKDFREMKGYAIYIKESDVIYNGLQNKIIPLCSDGIDNDEDGFIDMLDNGCKNSEYDNENLSVSIGSSSANPSALTIKVEEYDESDEVLVFTFKLEVDENSSDVSISKLPISVTIDNNDKIWNSPEDIISSFVVKIDGEEFNTDIGSTPVGVATGTFSYDVNLNDGEMIIESGGVAEVKIYLTLAEQGDIFTDYNYSNGTTINFSIDSKDIVCKGAVVSGSAFSNTHSLNNVTSIIDGFSWTVPSTGTYIDLFFSVEAEDEDFDVLLDDVIYSMEGTLDEDSVVLTKYSGTALTNTAGSSYTVEEGDTAKFRVRFNLTGTNGEWAEITIDSVSGQTIPEDKETSPTATMNIN